MNRSAPRSIDQYLKALRQELAGEDAAPAGASERSRGSVIGGERRDGSAQRLE
jgi:hypothetical protein